MCLCIQEIIEPGRVFPGRDSFPAGRSPRWKALFRFPRRQDGVSLVTTVLVVMLLSTISVALFSKIISGNKISVNHFSSSQSFWLAEAGIERSLHWLRYQDPPPGGVSPFTLYNDVSLAGGTYSVEIDPDDNNTSTYIKQYAIRSTGTYGPASRQLEVQVRMNTFGRYAYLTGDEGYGTIWFYTGDVIEGPLHSNDQIAINGTPTFMGRVTSSASSFLQGSSYNPTFVEGYQLNAPPVHFPTQQEIIDNYWSMNDSPPPLIIDARFGKDASVQFNSDGTITYSVWHWEGGWWNPYKVYDIQNATANIADLNGILYVRGDVRLKGTVKGRITVIATDDIYITDDLRYVQADATGRPDPSSTDVLGLISMRDVVVADTGPNQNDVVIDGAILALDESFYVENYDYGSPRGTLHLWGSLSQKVRGPVGTFGRYGRTGYEKDYHYDERFLQTPPPYYPTTGEYEIFSWRERTN